MKKLFILLLIIFLFPKNIIFAESEIGKFLDIKISKTLAYDTKLELGSDYNLGIFDKSDKETPIINFDYNKINVAIDKSGQVQIFDSNNNLIYNFYNSNDLIIGSLNVDDPRISIGTSQYRGYVKFLLKNDNIYIVNHVELDHYLYGVVPKEVPYSWPEETLKAQAVASRSFALSTYKHAKEGFNLCDTTCCQVYGGLVSEQATTTNAVDQTRGIFAFYDNKIIEAIYHSTSSGYTEDAKNVWGNEIPYLKAVKDDFSLSSPHNNWSVSVNLSLIESNLGAYNLDIGKIKNIEIIDFLDTGRVDKVKITGTKGTEIVTGGVFRALLGNVTLKSTYFTLNNTGDYNKTVYVLGANSTSPKLVSLDNAYVLSDVSVAKVTRGSVNRIKSDKTTRQIGATSVISGDEVLINGSGYGHGVGMSQYGAFEMGKLGYNYEEILKFYFTNIEVRKEY